MKTTIPTRPVASRYVNSAQCTSHRHFSTTSPHAVYVKHALRRVLPKDRSEIPHYPYGPSRLFKQSNKGLYGGLLIQHGNNVGKKFAVKTRRTWHPNIQPHLLYSRSLGRPIRLRVATRVLRTIDRLGGLDEYLVGSSTPARIRELGVTGWALRWRVLQTREMRKRFGITKEETDWLAEARRKRGLGEEEEGAEERVRGKVEAPGNEVAAEVKPDQVDEEEVDEETRREVEAFDRLLDEEDKKVEANEVRTAGTVADELRGVKESEEAEERREMGSAGREKDERRSAAEDEKPEKEEEIEMIQERRGAMDQFKGLFRRR